jgi:tetratricopeptide (TPR) repeat protein
MQYRERETMKTRTILLGVMLLSLFCAIVVPARAQTANNNFQKAVTAYQQSPSDATAQKMAAAMGQMPLIPPPPPPPPISLSEETLNQYLADLQKNPNDNALRGKIIALAQTMNPVPAIPDEARKYMDRGIAAIEGAKGEGDFRAASDEFAKAANLAPWLGNAYRNLAITQDKSGQYDAAIKNLQLYLLTAPSPADVDWAKSLINKVEYRRDKAQMGQDLLKALRNRDIPGALALLDKGADVKVENISGDTPLKLAVGINRIDVVRTLLDKGADVDASAGGLTPLMIAGMDGYADIARLLIDKGANVNAADNWGGTVLKWASCGGFASGANPEVVRMLINKGADLNARVPRFMGDAQGNSLLSLVTPSTGYLGTVCGKNQVIADVLWEAGAR